MVLELHYFPGRGRAEPVRLIALAGGVAFEDVAHKDWPARKAEMPFGQLPVLKDTESGFVLAQSGAIVRYVAKKAGLVPTCEKDAALADMYNEGINDLMAEFIKAVFYTPKEQVAESLKTFLAEKAPVHLNRFEGFATKNGSNGHIVGDKLTYADILFFNLFEILEGLSEGSIKAYPALSKIFETVAAVPAIAARVASADRPAPYKPQL